MQSDTVKLIASYGTAVIMAIGGSLLLVYVAMQPVEDKQGLMTLLGGFVGSSITFLFLGNSNTAAIRTYQSGAQSTTPEG